MYFEIDHDNDTSVVKTLTFVQLIEKAYAFEVKGIVGEMWMWNVNME